MKRPIKPRLEKFLNKFFVERLIWPNKKIDGIHFVHVDEEKLRVGLKRNNRSLMKCEAPRVL